MRECATALLQVAKRERIPVFLVGHVTKSGDLAGGSSGQKRLAWGCGGTGTAEMLPVGHVSKLPAFGW